MAGKHDRNSPSQLKKRRMCPGSVQLELAIEKATGRPLPDIASDAAIRGIVLHAQPKRVVEDGVKLVPGPHIEDELKYDVTDEDIEQVMFIVNHVRAEKQLLEDGEEIVWETQVDLNELGIRSEKDSNRIDLLFLKNDGIIHIFEFKFGRGWVDDPAFNWQVKAYAWGVLNQYGGNGVCVHLLQPNSMDYDKRLREHTFTSEELKKAGEDIKSIIESTKSPTAPLCKGYHCEFCAVKQLGVCPMWRDSFLNVPTHLPIEEHFKTLDGNGRAELYETLLDTQKFCKDSIKVIEKMILSGSEKMARWEVGTGRVSRVWTKPDQFLADSFPSLVKESIVSVAEAERQLGKKFFREHVEQYTETVDGAPKVVRSK